MPAPIGSYAALIAWLELEHEGFYSSLVCRDVPGAGRGMFVSRDIPGGETMLEIPSSALLNPLTLRISPLNTIPAHLFPCTNADRAVVPVKRRRQSLTATRLDTTQLLTLHLLLSRDPEGRHQSAWTAYIATLPDFEGWHPLTWVASGGEGVEELLGCLPVEAREKLEDVRKRYEADCEVLKGVLRVEDPFAEQNLLGVLCETDFLWAWLNVNTRTVSIPLDIPGVSSLQNHTLVPVLDMLNHTSQSSSQIPNPRQYPSSPSIASIPRSRHSAPTAPNGTSVVPSGPKPRGLVRDVGPLIPGKIGFRLIAPHKGLSAGDEVLFEYGSHSSATLFAEYGFVEGPYASESVKSDMNDGLAGVRVRRAPTGWLEKEHGCVDVGDLIREIWAGRGMDDAESEEKEDALRALSCFSRHVIHTTPSPPHPSHSLLMLLRALHLPPHSTKLASIRAGRICYISPTNEQAALDSLEAVCSTARSRAVEGVQRVKALRQRSVGAAVGVGSGPERLDGWVWDGLEGMWEEEREVLSAVLGRIERRETDW